MNKDSNHDTPDEDENSTTQERTSVSLCDDTIAEESETDDYHSINESDLSITSSASVEPLPFQNRTKKKLTRSEISSSTRKHNKKDNKLNTPRTENLKVNAKKQNINFHSSRESDRIKPNETFQNEDLKSKIQTKVDFHVYHPRSYHGYQSQDYPKVSKSSVVSETNGQIDHSRFLYRHSPKKFSPSRRESPRKHAKKILSYKEGWICSRCHIELSSEQALNYHMDNMICLQANNTQENSESVSKHMNEDRIECPHCMRKFAVVAGLKYHLCKYLSVLYCCLFTLSNLM
jgi:DNA-directed RNA polymerase subunit RPC12/RpoP